MDLTELDVAMDGMGVPSLPRSIVKDHGEATVDLEILTRTFAVVTLKCHEPRTYSAVKNPLHTIKFIPEFDMLFLC